MLFRPLGGNSVNSYDSPSSLFPSPIFIFCVVLFLHDRSIALFRILSNVISTHSVNGAYASAGQLICFLQVAALLEVIHGAIGIVPSGFLFTFMQCSGRIHFVFIVRNVVEVHEIPSVFITFFAWSLSEVIRYLHYALNSIGIFPPLVTYIRYSAFIILYPLGVAAGEMSIMYQALPFMKKKNLYSDFFAALPFSYYSFLGVLFVLYPFLLLTLYLHLLKQRRSKLGKKHRDKKNR